MSVPFYLPYEIEDPGARPAGERSLPAGPGGSHHGGRAGHQGGGPGDRRPPGRGRARARAATALAMAGCLMLGAGTTELVLGSGQAKTLASTATSARVVSASGTLTSTPNVGAILARVLPAVVSVQTTAYQPGSYFSPGGVVKGAGTGMILTSSGEVLTNNHVIAGAQSVTVTLHGQTKAIPAKVIGSDPVHDVALLQIQGARGLPTVSLGSSSAAAVGDTVLAIGNALALAGGPSVTEGIVSAENRTIQTNNGEHLTGLIQTDAAINPGNSGGPLVNTSGQVIGMNTAVVQSVGGYQASAQNIGFALAIDQVKPIVAQLDHGSAGLMPT
ncbi:MAG: S1C family serine protease [Acidimicrobiales bacterium]